MKIKNRVEGINWKNVLILILVFLIGFGAGSTVAFKVVFNKLATYNIDASLCE